MGVIVDDCRLIRSCICLIKANPMPSLVIIVIIICEEVVSSSICYSAQKQMSVIGFYTVYQIMTG